MRNALQLHYENEEMSDEEFASLKLNSEEHHWARSVEHYNQIITFNVGNKRKGIPSHFTKNERGRNVTVVPYPVETENQSYGDKWTHVEWKR